MQTSVMGVSQMFGCNFTALRRHKTSSTYSLNRYLVFKCISSHFSEYVPFVSHSRSVYHLTQLCVPHLIKTKGSIVNVSSVNGQRSVGIKQLATYCIFHCMSPRIGTHCFLSLVPWCAGLLHVQVRH